MSAFSRPSQGLFRCVDLGGAMPDTLIYCGPQVYNANSQVSVQSGPATKYKTGRFRRAVEVVVASPSCATRTGHRWYPIIEIGGNLLWRLLLRVFLQRSPNDTGIVFINLTWSRYAASVGEASGGPTAFDGRLHTLSSSISLYRRSSRIQKLCSISRDNRSTVTQITMPIYSALQDSLKSKYWMTK